MHSSQSENGWSVPSSDSDARDQRGVGGKSMWSGVFGCLVGENAPLSVGILPRADKAAPAPPLPLHPHNARVEMLPWGTRDQHHCSAGESHPSLEFQPGRKREITQSSLSLSAGTYRESYQGLAGHSN